MMDKYDRLLDAIEHPGNYTDDELNDLLSDPELRRAYRLMAASRSALIRQPEPDVDSEWDRFAAQHLTSRRPLIVRLIGRWPVAAAIVVGLVSIAAVAAGITITKAVSAPAAAPDAVEATRPDHYAGVVISEPDTVVVSSDSASVSIVTFKDETLSDLLNALGKHYGAEVEFKNPAARRLRLYYNWNPALTLDETVEQLNNFEQINLSLSNEKIVVN